MAFNQYPKIELTHIDTYEYESVNASGNKVKVDMYDPEKKRAQSPTELLLSALAACSAVDVVEILKKRRKNFSDFKVHAEGNRQEEHPRYFREITLTYSLKSNGITSEELEKHARMVLDKYCGVATTVSGKAKLHVKAEIHPE